ncbi:MAG: hypothetical protein WKF37_16260 [Bryobacteraceae bacterium]
MIRIFLFALSLALSQGQTPPKIGEKPTPKAKALELLERAAGIVSGAQPEVQVAGLLHVADLYSGLDKKKSLEYFDLAFAAAAALPNETGNDKRSYMQSQVIALTAEADLDRSIEMLRQLPPPPSEGDDFRVPPVNRIVGQIVAKKEYDRAIELVTNLGSEGEFAFDAAGTFSKHCP